MNTLTYTTANNITFKGFLFKNRRNRIIICLSIASMIIQFSVFKYLYPFASYIHGDSFSYLNAAYENLTINTYLVGYSKFLRVVSVFAKPDIVLVCIQYFSIVTSALFLLFTLFYFYQPSRLAQNILLGFMVLNPLFLHLGNLVSSDGIFLALSLTWFSLLLWIIHQPSYKIILWHAIVLFVAFTVRYNAMIYPVIAAIAFYLSKVSLSKKFIGIGLPVLLCGWFVGITMFQYKKLTGHWQYSPFSGWQLTNNAMYAYRYVKKSERKEVPQKYQVFDNMVRQYFDSTRDTKRFPLENIQASTFYMWSPGLPMYKYQDLLLRNDTTSNDFKKWALMGPFFQNYGLYIIRKYPLQFIQYFIWPNANKYYAPPIEFLEVYNSRATYVTAEAKDWFGYKTQNVRTRMKNNNVWVLSFYPILSGTINLVILCTLVCYVLLKGWQNDLAQSKGILLGSTVWLFNAVFTIWSSSAALRFQSFPILLTLTFALLLVAWLTEVASGKKRSTLVKYKSNIGLSTVIEA